MQTFKTCSQSRGSFSRLGGSAHQYFLFSLTKHVPVGMRGSPQSVKKICGLEAFYAGFCVVGVISLAPSARLQNLHRGGALLPKKCLRYFSSSRKAFNVSGLLILRLDNSLVSANASRESVALSPTTVEATHRRS
jgi:hypothetical protein